MLKRAVAKGLPARVDNHRRCAHLRRDDASNNRCYDFARPSSRCMATPRDGVPRPVRLLPHLSNSPPLPSQGRDPPVSLPSTRKVGPGLSPGSDTKTAIIKAQSRCLALRPLDLFEDRPELAEDHLAEGALGVGGGPRVRVEVLAEFVLEAAEFRVADCRRVVRSAGLQRRQLRLQ